ncbi:MAG: hypothetical protein ABIL44_01110 [candidate division WOR-3 bacterium]
MQLILQALDLGLDKDPRVMALINCVIRNPYDREKIALLSKIVKPKLVHKIVFGKPFKDLDETVDGEIRIATTESGLPVGFNPDEPHCLIAGQTNCGKTVLLNFILGQAMMKGHIVWLFTKAPDSRNLLKITKEILVVDFNGQIRFNFMLPPPDVDVAQWINITSDIFTQAYSLYDGTKNYLIDTQRYLFERNQTPTIFDLYRFLKSQKFPQMSRFARYNESTINRYGGVISGMGRTFIAPYIPLEELAKRNAIFEISGLTAEQQSYTVNTLLTWLFYYKLNSNSLVYHFVGIDDANLILQASYEYRPDRGLPIISHLLSTIRKSKVNVIAATQIPHQLGASIHSNAFTKIIFSLANGKDIECMARSIGIKEPDQIQYLHRLAKREIVVKFSGRYQEPFLAYVPEIDIFNGEISDEEIYTNNERILSSIPVINPPKTQTTEEETAGKTEGPELTPEEIAFLWDIVNRPYISVTERYRTINLER